MKQSGCISAMKLRKIRRGRRGHTVEHGNNKVKFSPGRRTVPQAKP